MNVIRHDDEGVETDVKTLGKQRELAVNDPAQLAETTWSSSTHPRTQRRRCVQTVTKYWRSPE